jgi:hypothetical protein
LSDLSPAPPGGPPSTSLASVVATTEPTVSTPRGPPSTSSTSVVAAAKNPDSNPRGPAINLYAEHHNAAHESWVATCQPCCTTTLKSQRTRLIKVAWEKDVGPTHGFVASLGVGPGATIDTLRTGYPCVQASSQDNGSGSCFPAGGSSGAATCPRGFGSHLPGRGSSRAATCPRGSGSCLSARGSSEAAACHLGSSTHLQALGSSGAATCPEDGLYRP